MITIADAVQGLDLVESVVGGLEFLADPLDVAVDGAVVDIDAVAVGCIHQLVAVLDVARPGGQRAQYQELGDRQGYGTALPGAHVPGTVQHEVAAGDAGFGRGIGFVGRQLLAHHVGVAAVPVIAVVDRGNSAGLVIPLLLAFALFLGKDRPWLAPGLVVGAALVRPQFILIALALVAIGRWRHAVAAAAAFIGITFASFALTAGGWSASARSWWDNVTGFQGGAGNIGLPTPANISIPRSVVSVGAWVGEAPGPIGSAGRWLAQSVYDRPLFAVGGVVLVATAVFLVAAGRVPRSVAITIPLVIAGTASTVSPVYYLSFALVLAALILGTHIAGGDEDGMLDGADGATTPTPWFWGWPLVIIIMLSLAPLPFALDTDPVSPLLRNAYILENIGKAWLALVLIGLGWVAHREFRVRWSASKGPVAPS